MRLIWEKSKKGWSKKSVEKTWRKLYNTVGWVKNAEKKLKKAYVQNSEIGHRQTHDHKSITDRQTDGRTDKAYQNHSSEPHKIDINRSRLLYLRHYSSDAR